MTRERRFEVLLAVAIVIVAALWVRALYIPSFADRHVAIAEEKLSIEVGDPGPWFSAWSLGDGQAFAVIATDPTGGLLGDEVKEPFYRFARAGYGWLAYAASLGQEHWVPYGLAITGAVSVAASLILAISLRERVGPKVWWLVLNPAIYLGFAGDTAEPLAVFLLALAISSGSVWAAAAVGVTRPTYLLGLVGRWRPLVAGVGAAVILGLYSLGRFGLTDLVPNARIFDFPLVGYIKEPTFFGWVLATLALVTGVLGVRHRDWAWVTAAVFVLCLASVITENPINAWRAAGMLPVLWAFGPGYEVVKTRIRKPASPIRRLAPISD